MTDCLINTRESYGTSTTHDIADEIIQHEIAIRLEVNADAADRHD